MRMTRDIGIDLGTASVLIHVKGRGIVLNEPSIVAIDTGSRRVLAVGTEAYHMVGRTPGNIVAIRPLKDGVIADFDVTEEMLKHFIAKVGMKHLFKRRRILICAPTGITSVEQKAIREAAEKSGASDVFLEEEPKLAAIGAGLDIFQPSGNMVVDIGGGTTDVAVLSMGDVVTSTSIKVAGDMFDVAITRHVKSRYKLMIGERTAEEIKRQVATVYPGARNASMEIRGRDLVSGLPRSVQITSEEVREALWENAASILLAARQVLEQTPPELVADVYDKGVILTGGGALLHGLDKLLEEELRIPVLIAEEPVTCVARGTGILLENLDRSAKAARKTRR